MIFTENLNPCNYLRLPTPHVFTSAWAELSHIDEQISSLDNHISQLKTLRNALLRRSYQINNLLAPVHNLPVEVLSYIFQQVVSLAGHDYHLHFDFYDSYRRCLRQALILSSVSTHFRHVAFGTPKLWKKIPLHISDSRAIGKALSLLYHCITRAPIVSVSVSDELEEEEASSAIATLLTSDAMQKVKAFELFDSNDASRLWIKGLENSRFPLLDTLSVAHMGEDIISLDLRNLSALIRLDIYGSQLGHPIFAPPSVLFLAIREGSPSMVISLLYQCPNLVEFSANIDPDLALEQTSLFADSGAGECTQLTKPLTLDYLKQLAFDDFDALETSSSAENLHLPSLESLRFAHHQRSEFAGVILLCRNASATLTSLIINSSSDMLDFMDLYRLCRLPLPKLRQLEVSSDNWSPFPSIIRALALLDSESRLAVPPHLPSLGFIALCCSAKVKPHILLDVLKKWRIGRAFDFHLQFDAYRLDSQDWVPTLREELMSIVGRSQVEVTWGDGEIC